MFGKSSKLDCVHILSQPRSFYSPNECVCLCLYPFRSLWVQRLMHIKWAVSCLSTLRIVRLQFMSLFLFVSLGFLCVRCAVGSAVAGRFEEWNRMEYFETSSIEFLSFCHLVYFTGFFLSSCFWFYSQAFKAQKEYIPFEHKRNISWFAINDELPSPSVRVASKAPCRETLCGRLQETSKDRKHLLSSI